jgi:hypothetical protein
MTLYRCLVDIGALFFGFAPFLGKEPLTPYRWLIDNGCLCFGAAALVDLGAWLVASGW